MSARIFYQSYEFSAGESRPWLSVKRQSIAETPGAVPQKALATYTVKTWFLEPQFADNQVRYRALLTALRGAGEGVLRMVDENEQEILNVRVRVEGDDLPEQWGQSLAEVTVTFTAIEDLTAGASVVDIAFTPSGAGSAITLPNVSRFSENLRADRYSPNIPHRRQTLGVVVARGEKLAAPGDALAARRTYLLALKDTLQAAMDCKEGALVFADFSKTVRIDSFECNLDDASTKIEWSLQASYQRFPAGTYAEAEFTVMVRDNREQSERLTSVKGKVRATDEAGALAKIATIETAYASGRMLRGKETSTPRVSGTDGDSFIDVDFSLEYRELIAVTSYKLSITTKDDTKSGQIFITYSGTVTSSSSSTAASTAASLGDGKHPIRMVAQVTIDTISVGGTAQFTQVTFSYEYLSKGTALYAEVTSDLDRQTFGQSTQVVSGYAVAGTLGAAETLARSFKPADYMPRSNKESVESLEKDGTPQFVKVTFSYAYHRDGVAGAVSYAVKTVENLQTRERTLSYSGTAYGPDESTANGMINGVIGAGQRLMDERESKFDKTGDFDKFLSRTFQISVRSTLSSAGEDILEAEYSVENIFSVNKAILTFIPFSSGGAHVQTGCGLTVGYRRVSGRIRALSLSTAKTWARAKAPAGGYKEEGADREREGTQFYAMSGTSVLSQTLDFDYSMAYLSLTPS